MYSETVFIKRKYGGKVVLNVGKSSTKTEEVEEVGSLKGGLRQKLNRRWTECIRKLI